MTDFFGVKLSQPFFDAETASDKDLIFSSEFPLLKEEKTGVFNINGLPHSGNLTVVHEHNLGYYPFYIVQDDQGKMRLGNEWQVDNNRLYFNDTSLFPPVGGSGNFRWTIYRLDVFAPFLSTNSERIEQQGEGVYDPKFIMAFTKKGKSIDSTDLRDFTIHSQARSPLVHSVNVRDWVSGATVESHVVTPDFSYKPIVFGFTLNRASDKVYNMLNGGQAPPTLIRSGNDISIKSSGNITQKSSIIVFKDPFLGAKDVSVIYG